MLKKLTNGMMTGFVSALFLEEKNRMKSEK